MTTKKANTKKATGGTEKKRSVGSATAASILGINLAPKKGDSEKNRDTYTPNHVKVRPAWVKFYNTLLDLRDRLMNQRNGLAKESAEELPGYSLHMADSGTDNFDRDFALSLLSSDQDAIYEIEEALRRIEKETYGVCELTGEQIPKARLEAIPWARFTVEAQMQLEKEGALRQRRLGALGSIDASSSLDVDDDDDIEEKPSKDKDS